MQYILQIRGGYNAGIPLPFSIYPNPFFVRRGFDLNPKPLCPLQGRDLTRKIAVRRRFSSS